MAERPSVKEILAAARQGSAARPADAEKSSPIPPAAKPEADTTSGPISGRPMTIQEKLAAARGGAKTPAPTASAAPEVLKSPEGGFTSVAAIESVEPEPATGRAVVGEG